MKNSRHLLLILSLTFFSVSYANQKSNTREKIKHDHKAHVHGSATLSIALESSKKGTLLLESPADNIFGFEHEAKSASDKKTKEDSLEILKSQASQLFVFAKEKNCLINSTKIEVKKDQSKSNHSEVEALFTFTCEKDLTQTNLQINLGKKFPKVEDLDVQTISDQKQSASELEKGIGIIKL
jgi:hypothetical protein